MKLIFFKKRCEFLKRISKKFIIIKEIFEKINLKNEIANNVNKKLKKKMKLL